MKVRILFLIAGVVIGAYLGGFLTSQNVSSNYAYCVQADTISRSNSTLSFATIKMPAVDQDGHGVTTLLDVEIVPGSGKTLTNVDKMTFWTDTQGSIRTAKAVAESITNQKLENVDLVYTIKANATLIEGPSAGAALTIATIAAIQNRTLNDSVMITGTINPDGSIGPVGGVTEKATAAKQIGALLFLVPVPQSSETISNPQNYCKKVGISQICSIEDVPLKVNVSQQAGIPVQEVNSVQDALKYFLA